MPSGNMVLGATVASDDGGGISREEAGSSSNPYDIVIEIPEG